MKLDLPKNLKMCIKRSRFSEINDPTREPL